MGALEVITLVGKVAAESNLAAAAIFALIKGVRDAWPKSDGSAPLSDEVLIAMMKSIFAENKANNLAAQAEIQNMIDAERGTI